MKQKNCFLRPYMLTICPVTITYLGVFYHILKTHPWKLPRACTCDQVCETFGVGCGFKTFGVRLVPSVIPILILFRVWSEAVFCGGIAGQVLTKQIHFHPRWKWIQIIFCPKRLIRYQSRPVPLVSVEEVNQWVENATNGHISNFLESIPHDVMLMLMNAVYFKGEPSYWKQKSFPFKSPNGVSWLPGEWQTQFDPLATSKGVFYLDNKNSVSVDMMKSSQYPFRLLHDPELKSQVNQQLSEACEAFSDAEVE